MVIYSSNLVFGFKFYAKTNSVLCEVGCFTGNQTEVILEDNEVIMGFVAKELSNHSPYYIDFQFMIRKK